MVRLIAIQKGLLVAVVFLALLVSSIIDSSAGERCRTDTPYYFSEFNPSSWKIENELNYEEVYKNFEYFEIVFNRNCEEMTVRKYVRGQFSSANKYILNLDGSISKIEKN